MSNSTQNQPEIHRSYNIAQRIQYLVVCMCVYIYMHTVVFLPGISHEQRILVGYSPWGLKESDTTEQLSTINHFAVQEKLTQHCKSIRLQ